MITITAFIFRVFDITNSKLWIDELYCFDIANQSGIIEILKTVLLNDLHAPLFFIILHFWMKLFGTADIALILLPLIFSTLSIPVGYFIAQKVFNQKTAVIFSLLTTFNSLQILYAQELKFYSLLPLLGLISFYYFWKTFTDFSVKSSFFLIVTNLLIIYTYNAGIIFVAAQFLTGLLYLLLKNKGKLKNFFSIYLCTFFAYLPYLYFQIKIYSKTAKSICSILDFFHFDFSFIYTLVQNFFTPLCINITNNPINYNIFSQIAELNLFGFIFYIIFPLGLAAYGLFKGLQDKEDKTILLFLNSMLFIVFMFALASLHIIPLLTRYVLLSHLLLVLLAAFGLSKIKSNKTLCTLLLLFFIVFNFIFIFTKYSVGKRKASSHYYTGKLLEKENVQKDDLILMPYMGRFLYKYFDKGHLIDHRAEELLFSPCEELMKETFDFSDKQNIEDDKSELSLAPYAKMQNPPKALELYFVKNYFIKMRKGDRLFLVENDILYILPNDYYVKILNVIDIDSTKLNELERAARYFVLYTKIISNLEVICSKHLKLIKIYNANDIETKILIYEKQ